MAKPEELLVTPDTDNEEEQEDRWQIEDDGQADWALEKIKELKEKQQEKQELAKERIQPLQDKIDKIKTWMEREVESIEKDIEYFEGLLTEYAMQLKEEDPELKTHSLPFGKLKFRKQRSKYNYNDDKLLEFLEENGIDAIRVKKNPDKRKLKNMTNKAGDKLVLDNGQVVEGVKIQERGEKFKIDVDGVD